MTFVCFFENRSVECKHNIADFRKSSIGMKVAGGRRQEQAVERNCMTFQLLSIAFNRLLLLMIDPC